MLALHVLWKVFVTQLRIGALSWGEVVSDPANAPMLEVAKRRRDAWGTFCRIVFDINQLSVGALLSLTLAATFRPVWKRLKASSIPRRCVAAVGAIACPRLVATFCMRWSASVRMSFRKELGFETYTAANATRDVLASASSMATSVVSLAIGEDILGKSGAGVILIGLLCFILGRCR